MREIEIDGILSNTPAINQFVTERKLDSDPIKLNSRWRSGNDIYLISTTEGKYILKSVNQPTWQEEIDYHIEFAKTYGGFAPQIHVREGNSYLMDYIEGDDFLKVMKRPFQEISFVIQSAGLQLREIYKQSSRTDNSTGVGQITYTNKYNQENGNGFLSHALEGWTQCLQEYPAQFIHNDLNTANVLVTSDMKVKAIDPRADNRGIKDVAKDLGRFLAAVTCAAYDNSYTKQEIETLSWYLLSPWETETKLTPRVAFYTAQSYLSFSRWDTERLAKESLFNVGLDLLARRPKSYHNFETLSYNVTESLASEAYEKKESREII